MKQVFVRGTLGDAYTASLKLIKEDVEIFHYTVHKQWYKEISEIYKMFHNIKSIEFIEFLFPETQEVYGIPEEGMIWFPNLDLPYIPIADKYVVIQAHAGREDSMARKINKATIRYMIELLQPVPIVLLGTDKNYKDIKCYENLIGETTIVEASSIVIDSYGFCGPEGYLAFLALSHKIPSVVFYVREQPVQARLLGNPWQNYIIDLIRI